MSSSSTGLAVTPRRSPDQRRAALTRANAVRTQRAQLKADLKRGALSLAVLVSDPPEVLAAAKVAELLRALPGYGPAKAARLLERCHVSPRKTFSGLTVRQREALIEALNK
jgi:hypothetical protein